MIEVILLCSGQPGSGDPILEGLSCNEEAVVRLCRRGDVWLRPMCVACAKAFEDFCAREGLPAPLFVLIPDAGEVVT